MASKRILKELKDLQKDPPTSCSAELIIQGACNLIEGATDTLKMGSEALRAAQAYRLLLRSVKKHIGREESKKHFADYVAQEFRKNCSLSDPALAREKINLAKNYTFPLNSVHHHKDLLFSYNIAVDRSDEVKRILGKSAASVGLKLPDVYQP